LYIHLVVVFCLNKLFFVNFNLHRSCKLGMRRTWCLCEFIATKCLSVVKHGACSKRLIPNRIFPIFGSRFRLGFLWDASIFFPSSCFVRRMVLVLRIQVPRRSRRRSPFARLPASLTLLTLATLQNIIVANHDTLLNFRSRICTYQCNCC
jgi:hypothetical protein